MDNCYQRIAINTKNESLCDRIVYWEYRDNCYLSVAGAKKDSEICNRIQKNEIRKACLKKFIEINPSSS
ncbi:MAG TPA: hypothetical protein EYP86_03380 [Candidatus Altiarchaeales archaeon]|nr:hypothetical protein [Candidatus Altiarchaeales archaeon]